MTMPAAPKPTEAGVPSPQAASCPRCGQGFHCGVNDGQPCACGSVALDGPQRAVLRQRYSSCLCGDCLRALVQQGIHIG